MLLEMLFWLFLCLVIYPYIIYPLLLIVFNKIKPVGLARHKYIDLEYEPYVTVLIPAYNEANVIEATVANKLTQQYPKAKLEIIVISDESEDGTDDIVKKFEKDGVKLIRQVPRKGKAAALNRAIKLAKGEIIVFSDANSIFDEFAVKNMVTTYSDKSIGYITGNLTYLSEKNGVSEEGVSAYIKYENKIRILESEFQSVIGVNGGVDSIRKELYKDVPDDQISDFVLPMHVMDEGYRVVYNPAIRSYEHANDNVGAEFKMRSRVALRAIRGLIYMRHLINPFNKKVRVSFSIISHKVIRYMGPMFLIGALFTNVVLSLENGFYQGVLFVHMLFYISALLGMSNNLPSSLNKVVVVPSYFLLTNIAFMIAFFKLIKGDKMATWNPREG